MLQLPPIYACLSGELKGVSGKLITRKKVLDLDFDKEYRDRLWTESKELINQILN